jgi:hypothetical protein
MTSQCRRLQLQHYVWNSYTGANFGAVAKFILEQIRRNLVIISGFAGGTS